jgi:drug/metabolite transporter (DMT)-like permease
LKRVKSAVIASKVDLMLLVVAIFWGSSYLAAKNITPFASIPGMLSVRFGVATIILLVIYAFRRDRFTRDDWILGTLYGFALAVIMSVETTGLSITSATNAGLIISLTIIFTPIIESAWNRNWLPKPFFVAAVGAIVGVALLVGGNGLRSPNWGDLLMLLAAVLRAVNTAAQGKLTFGKKVSSFNLTVMQTAFAGVAFFLIDPSGTIEAVQTFGPAQWANIFYLAVFCTVFGFIVLMWGIRKTSASRASLLLSTEPVWAVVVAVSFGGEQLYILGFVGAVMIIGSSYIGLGIENRHRGAAAQGSA